MLSFCSKLLFIFNSKQYIFYKIFIFIFTIRVDNLKQNNINRYKRINLLKIYQKNPHFFSIFKSVNKSLNPYMSTPTNCVDGLFRSGILRDKTMDDKLMYIPDYDKQN